MPLIRNTYHGVDIVL